MLTAHLYVVHPAGDGEVNAEDDDEHQQADEEEQPVLPPKLYTCRHTTQSHLGLVSPRLKHRQNKTKFAGFISNKQHKKVF